MSIITQEEVDAINALHNSASETSDKRSRRIMESRRRFLSRHMMASMRSSVRSASGTRRVGRDCDAAASPFGTSAEGRGTEPKEMFRTGSLSHLTNERTEDSEELDALNFDENYALYGDGDDGG